MSAATPAEHNGLRRAVLFVAVLNLSYFGVEFVVARLISSVSLYADSIDFLEDATVNMLVSSPSGGLPESEQCRNAARRNALSSSVRRLWTACRRWHVPTLPDATLLSAAGTGCARYKCVVRVHLGRFRAHGSSLTRAAWLSARNDAFANIAIICAGLVALASQLSIWPDLLVGAGIFLVNLDAARQVYGAARAARDVRRRGLTPPSSGRRPASFACFRLPLMSNVRPRKVHPCQANSRQ